MADENGPVAQLQEGQDQILEQNAPAAPPGGENAAPPGGENAAPPNVEAEEDLLPLLKFILFKITSYLCTEAVAYGIFFWRMPPPNNRYQREQNLMQFLRQRNFPHWIECSLFWLLVIILFNKGVRIYFFYKVFVCSEDAVKAAFEGICIKHAQIKFFLCSLGMVGIISSIVHILGMSTYFCKWPREMHVIHSRVLLALNIFLFSLWWLHVDALVFAWLNLPCKIRCWEMADICTEDLLSEAYMAVPRYLLFFAIIAFFDFFRYELNRINQQGMALL